MLHHDLTERVLAGAIEVHRELGPGLLESIYEACLARELHGMGLGVGRQVKQPVPYKGELLDAGYRLDLLVNNAIIVEVKSVRAVLPIHKAQLLTYLKLSGHRVGLLLNFNTAMMRQGITRLVL
jgi:GxxExxY protein